MRWVNGNCDLCESEEKKLIFNSTLPPQTLENTSYFNCTNTNYTIHGPIVSCKNCGLLYADPFPVEKDLQQAYAEVVDESYLRERAGKERTFRRHIGLFERYLSVSSRVLEVGCYVGFFLRLLTERGWCCVGVDPCNWAVRYAQDILNVDARISTGISSELQNGSFDLVVACDILEHVTSPSQFLSTASNALREGGYLFLTTIDVLSVPARLLGKRWHQFMLMHKTYFKLQDIKLYAAKHGFRIVSTRRHWRYVTLPYLFDRITSYICGGRNIIKHNQTRIPFNWLCLPIYFPDVKEILLIKDSFVKKDW